LYQGSYELDFLEKYYNIFLDIKSSGILNRDLEIEEKKKATIKNGFKDIR
jgi:hypothetical protein